MAILVNAHKISKAFSHRPLFTDLTLNINQNDRIGLVGPNGAGKSTLLRILSEEIEPDDGDLSIKRGLRVGLLEQVPRFSPNATLLGSVLEQAQESEGAHDSETIRLAQKLISQFDLEQFGENTEVQSLSGGWRKRVALARALVIKPDLLLLDEPTNHLDIESILWLESLLARATYATLTITHDRAFLQKISNRIIELNPQHKDGLLSVQGSYADFLEIRQQHLDAQEVRETVLKNTLRRETEWLRQGAKARSTKQQARIQRAGELKTEVEGLTQRNRTRSAQIEFQSTGRSPKRLLEATDLSKSFDEQVIFSDLNLKLSAGTRLGLLGRNGSGKSTLIKTLIGEEPPTQGDVFRSDQLSVAYFDQVRETLDPEVTVAETICPKGDRVDYRGRRIHIQSYLDRFLFDRGQANMEVGKLSGGEQSRVMIAKLMLIPANLLILDEPTNDLDMATLNILEDCLLEFDGAIILVSHDRYFLDQVSTTILAFPPAAESDRRLIAFSDLDQWENWHRQQAKSQSKEKSKAAGGKAKKKRLGFKEKRELEFMEENIQKAEALLAQVTEESAKPENTSDAKKLQELSEKMSAAQAEVDRLYARWSELEELNS